MLDDGLIINSTYDQYDKRYRNGFVGYQFPNRYLQQNMMSGEEYMNLQMKGYSTTENSVCMLCDLILQDVEILTGIGDELTDKIKKS